MDMTEINLAAPNYGDDSLTALKSDPGAPEKIYYHAWDRGDLADPQKAMKAFLHWTNGAAMKRG